MTSVRETKQALYLQHRTHSGIMCDKTYSRNENYSSTSVAVNLKLMMLPKFCDRKFIRLILKWWQS